MGILYHLPSSPGVCCNGCDDMGRLADESRFYLLAMLKPAALLAASLFAAPVAFAKAPPGRVARATRRANAMSSPVRRLRRASESHVRTRVLGEDEGPRR